ncbi:hypothetical protein SAMN05443252_109123 [Bacillus sp. OV322]|uniref:hypothetical protein n=1 Tax=Bacillus sp. OV322 TaxID=1882764 RepID=UPI0008EAC495|nr:hypothetical protein [Bacillus sp. OV322]SFC95248.1 hypothetical protein SAMN05443252_109123 [Bacillus sp. OV322]
MTVNRSGDLSPQYLEAYFKLVMASRQFHLDEAKEYIESTFFNGNPLSFGEQTNRRFIEAYLKIKEGKS